MSAVSDGTRYREILDLFACDEFLEVLLTGVSNTRDIMESAITSKGQATIPKAIRDHLGLKTGDRVKFFLHPDGSVVLLPKSPASSLRGIVKARRRVTTEEMNEAISAGASASVSVRKRR